MGTLLVLQATCVQVEFKGGGRVLHVALYDMFIYLNMKYGIITIMGVCSEYKFITKVRFCLMKTHCMNSK